MENVQKVDNKTCHVDVSETIFYKTLDLVKCVLHITVCLMTNGDHIYIYI